MGVYKIKELEQLTGIKAHTIRIWEKRYGLLKPNRSSTKIRLYDDQELLFLLQISLLNKKGIKISKLASFTPEKIQQLIKDLERETIKSAFHENLLIALITLDENRFHRCLTEISIELGFERVFTEYIIPFLEEIGIMWLIGSITPVQEHFITNLIRQKIIIEIDKIENPASGKTALLYLPEHEAHELTLLFYNLILRKNNIRTFYLGQHVPFDALSESIAQIKPHFLVSSWITSIDLNLADEYFAKTTKQFNIPLFVGGSFAKSNLKQLGSYFKLIDSGLILQSLQHM